MKDLFKILLPCLTLFGGGYLIYKKGYNDAIDDAASKFDYMSKWYQLGYNCANSDKANNNKNEEESE